METTQQHSVRFILLSIYLFGIYCYFSWSQGPLVLPFTISMVAGSLLLIYYAWLPIRFIYFFICITGFIFCHTLLTYSSGTIYTIEKVKAAFLFMYAILFALIFLKELLLVPNEKLANFFYYWTVGIGVACLLHTFFPPFQVIHNFFLSTLHGMVSITPSTSLRDIALHGGIMRPFPLTTEPSHVAKFVFVTWSAWLYLSKYKNYLLFFVGSFLLFAIIRSVIVLPLFGVGIIAFVTEVEKKHKFLRLLLCLLLSIALLPLVIGISYQLLEGRILQMLQGDDLSTVYRLILPNYLGKAVLLNNAFWGVGIGNVEYILELYNDLDSRLFFIDYQPNFYYFTSFVAPILYFGIVGTLLFFGLLYLFFFRTKYWATH